MENVIQEIDMQEVSMEGNMIIEEIVLDKYNLGCGPGDCSPVNDIVS